MEETADGMEDKRMDSGMMSMKMAFDDATPLCLSPDTAEILTERGIDLTLLSTLHDTMVEKYDTMTMKDDAMSDDAMEDDAMSDDAMEDDANVMEDDDAMEDNP